MGTIAALTKSNTFDLRAREQECVSRRKHGQIVLDRFAPKAAARRSDCHWQAKHAKSTGRPRGRGCFWIVADLGQGPVFFYRRKADVSATIFGHSTAGIPIIIREHEWRGDGSYHDAGRNIWMRLNPFLPCMHGAKLCPHEVIA